MPRPALALAALAAGACLTLMTLFNSAMGVAASAFFASWAAHGTGTVAALLFIGLYALAGRRPAWRGAAPLWSFGAGLAGAVIVILTAIAVNGGLALSGTIALGLAGQVLFGLAADRLGLFGLARRRLAGRDVAAAILVLAGSVVLIRGAGA